MILDQAEKLRALVHERISSEKLAYVIAIASGKGGCGKSNIALNLGLILSRNGKKTLLYDADVNLANIDILLGVSPSYRLLDFIRGNAKLRDVLIEVRENLKLLPANSGSVEFPKLSTEQLLLILDELLNVEKDFDFIIIDAPAGVSDEVLNLLSHSDEPIVVLTPEPTSIMDAYALIKLLYFKTGKSNVKVIVNAVNGSVSGEEIATRLSMVSEKFLGVRLGYLGSIPFDPLVQKAVIAQRPFVELYPRSGASIALKKIGEKFLTLNDLKKQKSFFGRMIEI